jgi:CRP-like cAMP-binding protein
MTEQEFATGWVFFRPGDPADRAYLLHDGQVELLAGADGGSTRVALVEPGEVFGEMALIEERPRALTARAVRAARATPMTRDEFEHLLTHDPARTRQYLRTLFERLRSLSARLGAEVEPVRAEPAFPLVPVEGPRGHGPVELRSGQGKPAAWVVVIHPLTHKAAETLPDEGLRVTRFPLRIGRAAAPHEPEALDLNDMWLLDDKPYNVSRNHCEIHVDREGPLVRDRGSHLGCIVNDKWVGGQAIMGYARLDPGDNVVVIGARMSPYQFRVTVSPV